MSSNIDYLLRTGTVKLLEIKDSDIRIATLEQARDAIDKGIHIGGAVSSVIPLVSLFYSGVLDLDVVNPTRRGQDMFVLSKGHVVAPMAAIFADMGYFDRSVLAKSRSWDSILNGHPGPILPGVHISTGPLAQGLGVAQGFALGGKLTPAFDVFCITGDGELQEGLIWEAVMYSGYRKLDNLCIIIDRNSGQLDDTKQLIFPMVGLDRRLESFGWRVFNVDGTQYGTVLQALESFKYDPRDGRPTAIISRTRKGYGAFSSFMTGHKVTLPDDISAREIDLQQQRRAARIAVFLEFFNGLATLENEGKALQEKLLAVAARSNLEVAIHSGNAVDVKPKPSVVKTKRAPVRGKEVSYDDGKLPKLDMTQKYAANSIITQAMRVFAGDPKVVSIDADLASTSGLEAGIEYVDMKRALNVGIAEGNMMNIGEAFAAMGYNTWVSTFTIFFDWKVLRRIAIGYQERLEAIAAPDGWLSTGHGLDITFLATASDIDTVTNGATHMGNDDVMFFSNIPHLKIINVSCPRQMLGVMKWIMEGNKGLVYVRILRAATPVIYDEGFTFDYGRGYTLRGSLEDKAVIIASGRAVFESLAAAEVLAEKGIKVGVVDMPSIDEELLLKLYDSGKLLVISEQNNGYIWSQLRSVLFRERRQIDAARILAINTLDKRGRARFIHSATYSELIDHLGLSPEHVAKAIRERLKVE